VAGVGAKSLQINQLEKIWAKLLKNKIKRKNFGKK
jgi:hypothetical protein